MNNTKEINGYRIYIDQIIGRGAFGIVYKCMKITTQEILAVKCISYTNILKDNLSNYLETEIKSLKSIDHKNIIKFYGVERTQNNIYIMMEMVRGFTLTDYLLEFIKIKRTIPSILARKIIRQIAEGMKHYHGKNILHRDLKTDNILIHFNKEEDYKNKNILSLDIEAKIIDFGASKIKNYKCEISKTIIGSALNMDPRILFALEEQQNNRFLAYDFEVDIWSFGIICYFIMFNNNMPFKAQTNKDLVNRYKKGEYVIYSFCYVDAFDFISRILITNIIHRANIDSILNHPYLNLEKEYKENDRINTQKIPSAYFLDKDQKRFLKMNIDNIHIREEILKYLNYYPQNILDIRISYSNKNNDIVSNFKNMGISPVKVSSKLPKSNNPNIANIANYDTNQINNFNTNLNTQSNEDNKRSGVDFYISPFDTNPNYFNQVKKHISNDNLTNNNIVNNYNIVNNRNSMNSECPFKFSQNIPKSDNTVNRISYNHNTCKLQKLHSLPQNNGLNKIKSSNLNSEDNRISSDPYMNTCSNLNIKSNLNTNAHSVQKDNINNLNKNTDKTNSYARKLTSNVEIDRLSSLNVNTNNLKKQNMQNKQVVDNVKEDSFIQIAKDLFNECKPAINNKDNKNALIHSNNNLCLPRDYDKKADQCNKKEDNYKDNSNSSTNAAYSNNSKKKTQKEIDEEKLLKELGLD